MRVAVVSDTHGLLRPETLTAIAGADHILHAGDVGDITILDRLREIAPVTAIRGNVDVHGDCALLPATEAIELNRTFFYMLHSIDDLDISPQAAGFHVVVYGHSHQPSVKQHKGVMYLNPGSCGPRRFKLPVTVAMVETNGGVPTAEIAEVVGS